MVQPLIGQIFSKHIGCTKTVQCDLKALCGDEKIYALQFCVSTLRKDQTKPDQTGGPSSWRWLVSVASLQVS